MRIFQKKKPKQLNLDKVKELQVLAENCPSERQSEMIQLIREALSYTRSDMARAIGVEAVTIARWEDPERSNTPTLSKEQIANLKKELDKLNLDVMQIPDLFIVLTKEQGRECGLF